MTTELKWYTRSRKHPFSQKEGSNGEIKKTYRKQNDQHTSYTISN